VRYLVRSTLGVEGHARTSGWGLGTMGKHVLIKLTTAQTWGKSPPSPYSIFYAWPRDQHPNVIFS